MLFTKLRQAACNPALIDASLKIESSKTAAFCELVNELVHNDHRALVFSQFTSHLALIRKALDDAHIEYLYLDGSTPARERTRLVKDFQEGSTPLFLISLKAGGLGLNLTAADYVIHLDPWWNPAIEDQASDRAYRMGQTKPVTVYRLIAAGTIEEKIIRLHETKKSLADSLLEGSNQITKISADELLALLMEK
jgi:SNF2 family DNA or RNA helicase